MYVLVTSLSRIEKLDVPTWTDMLGRRGAPPGEEGCTGGGGVHRGRRGAPPGGRRGAPPGGGGVHRPGGGGVHRGRRGALPGGGGVHRPGGPQVTGTKWA